MTTIEPEGPSDKQALDTLLGQAQLNMPQDEYDLMLRNYAQTRANLASLRIPEARYAEPASIFPAGDHL